MQKQILALVFACLLGVVVSYLPAGDAKAGLSSVPNVSATLQHQNLVTPARVWRDCQRIARCNGCTPVYRCRSCSYQKQCYGRLCEWGDVCVWGPYIPLAPKGVRVY
ncbi:MAG: hypothetical protein MUO41_07475 [Methyloceanibacter sp.]|jgi:hypothetical protein|nr:hypothetical protein [Methyloceanibacter sp.]